MLAVLLPLLWGGAQGCRIQSPTIISNDWIEPYPYLNGGAFTGPALRNFPDPLGSYVWPPGTNASQLQVFFVSPTTVSGTPSSAFVNLDSLTGAEQWATVSGPATLQFYFCVEFAAWLEFDSPNLSAGDAAQLTMSLSEYNEPEMSPFGFKTGKPVPYKRSDGNVTYRLETNPGLYEGVRFGWLTYNGTATFNITGLRCVAQVKPTNWVGSFQSASDNLLTMIWYASAYTVKANLLSDQIGAVLIYRGDRYSWTGQCMRRAHLYICIVRIRECLNAAPV